MIDREDFFKYLQYHIKRHTNQVVSYDDMPNRCVRYYNTFTHYEVNFSYRKLEQLALSMIAGNINVTDWLRDEIVGPLSTGDITIDIEHEEIESTLQSLPPKAEDYFDDWSD